MAIAASDDEETTRVPAIASSNHPRPCRHRSSPAVVITCPLTISDKAGAREGRRWSFGGGAQHATTSLRVAVSEAGPTPVEGLSLTSPLRQRAPSVSFVDDCGDGDVFGVGSCPTIVSCPPRPKVAPREAKTPASLGKSAGKVSAAAGMSATGLNGTSSNELVGALCSSDRCRPAPLGPSSCEPSFGSFSVTPRVAPFSSPSSSCSPRCTPTSASVPPGMRRPSVCPSAPEALPRQHTNSSNSNCCGTNTSMYPANRCRSDFYEGASGPYANFKFKLSDLQPLIASGDFPFVVASAAANKEPHSPTDSPASRAAKTLARDSRYDWVEISPFYIRHPTADYFTEEVDDSPIYFLKGTEHEGQPDARRNDLRLHHVLAVLGSAFAADVRTIAETMLPEGFLRSGFLALMKSPHASSSSNGCGAAVTSAPFVGDDVAPLAGGCLAAIGFGSHPKAMTATVRDAGIDNNLPFAAIFSASRIEQLRVHSNDGQKDGDSNFRTCKFAGDRDHSGSSSSSIGGRGRAPFDIVVAFDCSSKVTGASELSRAVAAGTVSLIAEVCLESGSLLPLPTRRVPRQSCAAAAASAAAAGLFSTAANKGNGHGEMQVLSNLLADAFGFVYPSSSSDQKGSGGERAEKDDADYVWVPFPHDDFCEPPMQPHSDEQMAPDEGRGNGYPRAFNPYTCLHSPTRSAASHCTGANGCESAFSSNLASVVRRPFSRPPHLRAYLTGEGTVLLYVLGLRERSTFAFVSDAAEVDEDCAEVRRTCAAVPEAILRCLEFMCCGGSGLGAEDGSCPTAVATKRAHESTPMGASPATSPRSAAGRGCLGIGGLSSSPLTSVSSAFPPPSSNGLSASASASAPPQQISEVQHTDTLASPSCICCSTACACRDEEAFPMIGNFSAVSVPLHYVCNNSKHRADGGPSPKGVATCECPAPLLLLPHRDDSGSNRWASTTAGIEESTKRFPLRSLADVRRRRLQSLGIAIPSSFSAIRSPQNSRPTCSTRSTRCGVPAVAPLPNASSSESTPLEQHPSEAALAVCPLAEEANAMGPNPLIAPTASLELTECADDTAEEQGRAQQEEESDIDAHCELWLTGDNANGPHFAIVAASPLEEQLERIARDHFFHHDHQRYHHHRHRNHERATPSERFLPHMPPPPQPMGPADLFAALEAKLFLALFAPSLRAAAASAAALSSGVANNTSNSALVKKKAKENLSVVASLVETMLSPQRIAKYAARLLAIFAEFTDFFRTIDPSVTGGAEAEAFNNRPTRGSDALPFSPLLSSSSDVEADGGDTNAKKKSNKSKVVAGDKKRRNVASCTEEASTSSKSLLDRHGESSEETAALVSRGARLTEELLARLTALSAKLNRHGLVASETSLLGTLATFGVVEMRDGSAVPCKNGEKQTKAACKRSKKEEKRGEKEEERAHALRDLPLVFSQQWIDYYAAVALFGHCTVAASALSCACTVSAATREKKKESSSPVARHAEKVISELLSSLRAEDEVATLLLNAAVDVKPIPPTVSSEAIAAVVAAEAMRHAPKKKKGIQQSQRCGEEDFLTAVGIFDAPQSDVCAFLGSFCLREMEQIDADEWLQDKNSHHDVFSTPKAAANRRRRRCAADIAEAAAGLVRQQYLAQLRHFSRNFPPLMPSAGASASLASPSVPIDESLLFAPPSLGIGQRRRCSSSGLGLSLEAELVAEVGGSFSFSRGRRRLSAANSSSIAGGGGADGMSAAAQREAAGRLMTRAAHLESMAMGMADQTVCGFYGSLIGTHQIHYNCPSAAGTASANSSEVDFDAIPHSLPHQQQHSVPHSLWEAFGLSLFSSYFCDAVPREIEAATGRLGARILQTGDAYSTALLPAPRHVLLAAEAAAHFVRSTATATAAAAARTAVTPSATPQGPDEGGRRREEKEEALPLRGVAGGEEGSSHAAVLAYLCACRSAEGRTASLLLRSMIDCPAASVSVAREALTSATSHAHSSAANVVGGTDHQTSVACTLHVPSVDTAGDGIVNAAKAVLPAFPAAIEEGSYSPMHLVESDIVMKERQGHIGVFAPLTYSAMLTPRPARFTSNSTVRPSWHPDAFATSVDADEAPLRRLVGHAGEHAASTANAEGILRVANALMPLPGALGVDHAAVDASESAFAALASLSPQVLDATAPAGGISVTVAARHALPGALLGALRHCFAEIDDVVNRSHEQHYHHPSRPHHNNDMCCNNGYSHQHQHHSSNECTLQKCNEKGGYSASLQRSFSESAAHAALNAIVFAATHSSSSSECCAEQMSDGEDEGPHDDGVSEDMEVVAPTAAMSNLLRAAVKAKACVASYALSVLCGSHNGNCAVADSQQGGSEGEGSAPLVPFRHLRSGRAFFESLDAVVAALSSSSHRRTGPTCVVKAEEDAAASSATSSTYTCAMSRQQQALAMVSASLRSAGATDADRRGYNFHRCVGALAAAAATSTARPERDAAADALGFGRWCGFARPSRVMCLRLPADYSLTSRTSPHSPTSDSANVRGNSSNMPYAEALRVMASPYALSWRCLSSDASSSSSPLNANGAAAAHLPNRFTLRVATFVRIASDEVEKSDSHRSMCTAAVAVPMIILPLTAGGCTHTAQWFAALPSFSRAAAAEHRQQLQQLSSVGPSAPCGGFDLLRHLLLVSTCCDVSASVVE